MIITLESAKTPMRYGVVSTLDFHTRIRNDHSNDGIANDYKNTK